jgi:nucleotidyltransferase/DNA polymerase involved in DNA repair
MGAAFVETLPVGKFHGIGPATSAKMNRLAGLDMRNQTLEFMNANFGKAGSYYYWISPGIDERPVRANRIRKSVGAENTFAGYSGLRSSSGGIAAADREGLASLREHGRAGPDGEAQGEVFRFRVDHPQ